MSKWIGRILSLCVLGFYVWVVVRAQVVPGVWFIIVTVLGLAMIWLDPDYFTRFSFLTTSPHDAPPGCAVRLLGWFLLLMPLGIGLVAGLVTPS